MTDVNVEDGDISANTSPCDRPVVRYAPTEMVLLVLDDHSIDAVGAVPTVVNDDVSPVVVPNLFVATARTKY